MGNLSIIGRVFYGIAMAAMGLLTICDRDFPYMLIPPRHSWLTDHVLPVYIAGILLFLAGACIVIEKKIVPISLLLGAILLLIFCFYFIPYELTVFPNSMHFGAWENAAKELALAAGAFVIAGCYPKPNENPLIRLLGKLIPLGVIFYSLAILSFGIDHYLYAAEAVGYIPSWVPDHLFWLYVTGTALLCSGIGILFKIKRGLCAFLLGAMIFIWVIILHIPKALAAPLAENEGEVTSAFIALAYCGIAFVIAGTEKGPKKS